MRRHVIRSLQAPEVPAASQAISVEVQRLTFVSGQLGVDTGGHLVGAGARAQCAQALANVRSVLASGGLTLDAVESVTLYVTDLADLPEIDAVYQPAFVRPPPARSVVQVAALPSGARLMVAAIAGG